MDADTHPSPITAVLWRAVAEAIEQGRTNYLTLEWETGVARASIRRFVSGERTLRLDMADRLATYFGLKLQQQEKGDETMAHWWANQGQAFEQQRARGDSLGYLWAPHRDSGRFPHYWQNMQHVRPDDVVFSHVHGAIVALAVVRSAPRRAPRPADFATQPAGECNGWLADVEYTDIRSPILIRPLVRRLLPLMPAHYGPLNRNGIANQGYLYRLPPPAAQLLLTNIPSAPLEEKG
jgi:hypothetical protein